VSLATLYCGDVLTVLATLPAESVQCVVTSPPYWGLRDYGVTGQLGLERTPEEYVARMVGVFMEVQRVLRDDGTLWLNMGDGYCAAPNSNVDTLSSTLTTRSDGTRKRDVAATGRLGRSGNRGNGAGDLTDAPHRGNIAGLKPKDLLGMPWRLAFALQADGWWLRSDIIWSKPNPMPESVTDRPTKAHEYVFLLSKSERYYYDAAAIAEECSPTSHGSPRVNPGCKADADGFTSNGRGKSTLGKWPPDKQSGHGRRYAGFNNPWDAAEAAGEMAFSRNARTVWEIATQPYPQAHFATFPEELARRCILAGSRPGDRVLDPFGGPGTVAQVATGNGRESIYIDLNPKYVELAKQRIGPMLCQEVPPAIVRTVGD
jgi:DNA modification methylase